MEKFLKYVPFLAGILWLACVVISLLRPNMDYRIEFILTSALLTGICFANFWGGVNDRKTKGPDNKP